MNACAILEGTAARQNGKSLPCTALADENEKLRELAWRLLEVDRIGATSNEWSEIRELARELGVEV